MLKYPMIKLFFIVWALSAAFIYFGCDMEALGKPIKTVTSCSGDNGAAPSCWNDKDWEVFCERVRCKTDKDDCWREYTDCELYDKPRPEQK